MPEVCKIDLDMQIGYMEKQLEATRFNVKGWQNTSPGHPQVEMWEEHEAYQEAVLKTLQGLKYFLEQLNKMEEVE